MTAEPVHPGITESKADAALVGIATLCELLMDTNPHITRDLSVIAAKCEDLLSDQTSTE